MMPSVGRSPSTGHGDGQRDAEVPQLRRGPNGGFTLARAYRAEQPGDELSRQPPRRKRQLPRAENPYPPGVIEPHLDLGAGLLRSRRSQATQWLESGWGAHGRVDAAAEPHDGVASMVRSAQLDKF